MARNADPDDIHAPHAGRWPWWLASAVACALFAFSGAQVLNVDAAVYVAQAESLWLGIPLAEATESLDEMFGGGGFWVADRWGVLRGRYPPGVAIVLGPGVVAGRALAALTGAQRARAAAVVAWLCALLGAGTALLAKAFLAMGLSPRAAAAGASVVVLGDAGVWIVTNTVWAESAVAFVLCVVWWLAARSGAERRTMPATAVALGASVGFLPWVHASLWPAAAILCVLLWVRGRGKGTGAWIVPASAGVVFACLAFYNLILFGDPVLGGYIAEEGEWSGGEPFVWLLVRIGALLTHHTPAVLGYGGAVLLAIPFSWGGRALAALGMDHDGADRELVGLRRLGIAALAVGLSHLLVYSFRVPHHVTRLTTPQTFLLVPGLAALLFGAPSRRRLVFGIGAAAIAIAIVMAILHESFLARIAVEGHVRAVPRVWWWMAAARSAWWYVAGAVVCAASVFCAFMVARRLRAE